MNKRQAKKKRTVNFTRVLKMSERRIQRKLDKEGIIHRSDKSKRHMRKRLDAIFNLRAKMLKREVNK